MTRLEGSSDSTGHDGALPVEPELHRAGEEVREVHEGPTNHLGYKDASCREFRERYPDDYLEPMSRPRSVEPFQDPRETVDGVNPDFGALSGGSYENNCADCARCFERTWRGMSEEAAGRAETPDEGGRFAVRGEEAARTEAWAGESFTPTEDVAAIERHLRAAGHGSSAIVASQWEQDGDRGGHAYNLVNHRGEVLVVDAQHHEVTTYDDVTIHPGFARAHGHQVMMWDPEGRRIF